MGPTMCWMYNDLPGVELVMEGDSSSRRYPVYDESDKSYYDQEFQFRIDEETEEFVIRFKRKLDVCAPQARTDVAVKIQGGLTKKPSGSVVFDGGVGDKDVLGTFNLSFKMNHTRQPEDEEKEDVEKEEEEEVEEEDEEEEQPEEEPAEKEVSFFDHSKHKLLLARQTSSSFQCDACDETIEKAKWTYSCPNKSCDYGVHVTCAQLARTIQHPIHTKHALNLVKLGSSDGRVCDSCTGYIPQGLCYHCAKCDVDVHPVCPTGDDIMTPEQYLAHLVQVGQQQSRFQAMQLENARRSAAMMANAGRAIANLAGPRACYRNCWPGSCTC